MRIGFVQFHPVFGGVARNIAKAVTMARSQQADLWVLPELFATGYQFTGRDEASTLAEGTGGPTVRTMTAKAEELGCWFCGGFPEKEGRRVFNSAFLVGPRGQLHVYRKVHLFDREKELFAPGDAGFAVFDLDGVKVGMMICFDWIFPESARTLALAGAQIILHPANLVLPHCPDAMKTRALENRVFTVTANRIGTESRHGDSSLTFVGQSIIYGPDGKRLADAGVDEECATVVEIDPTLAMDKSVGGNNNLIGDRRTVFYRLV